MIYRQMGRTGLRVSQLGFGAMRLPMKDTEGVQVVDGELAIPMIHRVNRCHKMRRIDSAPTLLGGQ